MPSLAVGAFALAGLAAAAGPVVAHLMNRRRFRTIDWAAMNFLREAVRQSRRVLHLRDLLLLLLRVACVLIHGGHTATVLGELTLWTAFLSLARPKQNPRPFRMEIKRIC